MFYKKLVCFSLWQHLKLRLVVANEMNDDNEGKALLIELCYHCVQHICIASTLMVKNLKRKWPDRLQNG